MTASRPRPESSLASASPAANDQTKTRAIWLNRFWWFSELEGRETIGRIAEASRKFEAENPECPFSVDWLVRELVAILRDSNGI